MLSSIKRFLAQRGGNGEPDMAALAAWAERRGHAFRPARRGEGFVIEGVLDERPWRIEWGPSQRAYIHGRELRVRMELELPSDQQMLLLSAPLMDALERQAFEQYTDHLQTQMDTEVPEEMRWLVMLPKVDFGAGGGGSLGVGAGGSMEGATSGNLGGGGGDLRALAAHFGAISSQPAVGRAWIEGPLARQLLQEAESGVLRGDPPLVLITLRGRTYLRLQMAVPEPDAIAAVLALFETAIAQAVRAAGMVTDTSASWVAGASTTWQSLQPAEQPDPRKRR